VPKHVTNLGRVSIKTDIPSQIDIPQFGERFDVDIDAEQMSDPPLHDAGKRAEPIASRCQIEGHIELITAIPIAFGVATVDNVDVCLRWNAEHGNERAHRRRADAADYFLVCRDQ